MALDLSRDYLIIDDPVTVSYASKLTSSTWTTPIAVAYCQRNSVSKEDLKLNAALLTKQASVFHLWTANLGGVVPKIGDKLAHGGGVWVVESVGELDRDANGVQRYRVVVTRSTGSQTLP